MMCTGAWAWTRVGAEDSVAGADAGAQGRGSAGVWAAEARQWQRLELGQCWAAATPPYPIFYMCRNHWKRGGKGRRRLHRVAQV